MLREEFLAYEGENLEVFQDRGVIRVTTLQHKLAAFLLLLRNELGSIRRKTLLLRDLYPDISKTTNKSNTIKKKKFHDWVDQHFNETALKEISQMTMTDIKMTKDHVSDLQPNND